MNPVSRLLSDELEKRKSKNKSFSLRAMARVLELEPSALSKLLKGQRIPTQKTKKKIFERLSVPESQVHQIEAWIAKSKKQKKLKEEFVPFDPEKFENEIEIHHLILLEALRIPVFADSVSTLCKALNMDPKSFDQTLKDLEQMNMLDFDPETDSVRILREHNTTIPLALPSEKRKEIQKQFLQLALKVMDQVSFEERDNSTLTIAIPKSKVPHFKALISQARRRINKEADRNLKNADSVYNLTIAFCPVVVSEK